MGGGGGGGVVVGLDSLVCTDINGSKCSSSGSLN